MSELQQLKRSSKVSFQEPPLPKSSVIIWIIGIGLLVLLSWAWLFKLEEVSTGTGKIIPSSKEQVIQSLDGGILITLNVKEGEIVERGQVLAQLDPTRFESNVGESESLLVSSRATSARLRAEVTGVPLVFPEEVLKYPNWLKKKRLCISRVVPICKNPLQVWNRLCYWCSKN